MAAPPVIARTATYHHTRVGRTELDKLLRVAGEAAPAGTVSVSCTVGSAQLQEDTLDDLIAARAALPHVSDRTPWTELTLERDEGTARYVGVELKDGVVTVTVRSVDPIWTHGQAHRLGEILEEAHGAVRRRSRVALIGQLALATILGAGIGFAYVSAAEKHDVAYYGIGGGAWANLLLGGAALAREWVNGRGDRPVLNVLGDVPWGSALSRLSIANRIGLASVVIAGLSFIAAVTALF